MTTGTAQSVRDRLLKLSRDGTLTLVEVVDAIGPFLHPVLDAARGGPALSVWPAGGPWTLVDPNANTIVDELTAEAEKLKLGY